MNNNSIMVVIQRSHLYETAIFCLHITVLMKVD